MSLSSEKRFRKLYDEYHMMVRNVLYNMAGAEPLEDLTQETFIKIWNGLPRFAFRSSIKTWIYRITINTASDYLRSKKTRSCSLDELMGEEMIQATGEQDIVEHALADMEEDGRAIIILFYFEDMSLNDIAETLNIPLGTVKSRLHHAKRKLKDFLQSKGVSV